MKNYWIGKHRYENEKEELQFIKARYAYINGELKDVKVFDKVFTEEEIQWMNVSDEELDSWYGGCGVNRGHVPSITEVFINNIVEEEDQRAMTVILDAITGDDKGPEDDEFSMMS